MKITRNEKKQEALKRMKYLKLHSNTLRELEREDVVNYSEAYGILYWLDEKWLGLVKDFEIKHKALVYHAIHNYTEFGELLTLLYVSDYKNEWEADWDDLHEGHAVAYVINLDDETCSEFGGVGIKPQFGGLVRTY